jgi:signal transduction histidine kinase
MALTVLAIFAVNVVGVWGIAVARRGINEEAERLFRVETAARGRLLESLVASTRADLAFLAGSPAFLRVQAELASSNPTEAVQRQRAVEGVLLIFMRGHPHVTRILLRSGGGRLLMAAVRRGGVPVVWLPSAAEDTQSNGEDVLGEDTLDPTRISGVFVITAGEKPGPDSPRLVASIEGGALLAAGAGYGDTNRFCMLEDQGGTVISSEVSEGASAAELASLPRDEPVGSEWLYAETGLRTDGWAAMAPWRLTCLRRRAATTALVEPVESRYRSALILNLAVMVLAVLLGSFAMFQIRRRAILEARNRAAVRVRELERQLSHAERLSTVGRLAAGIAHEINNPLEGMLNYLHLAEEDLRRKDLAAAGRHLEGVGEGLESAAGIVRRVLAHADPSAPPQEILDLKGILARSAEWVSSRKQFSSIDFVVDLAGDGQLVRGNEVQLSQVFLNLLLNACEVQPDGGEVRVACRREAAQVAVEVADRGPGVPEEDRVRIFEPFFSSKDSTGLGLSVSYSIIKQHQGELSVEPRPGGGSVFSVKLPVLEEDDV